ncbi:PH-domain-containing protein [Lichtheimia hyalospora FSU 10163]|nr:PH-domain-containing protein [Lichtheimia hyalospora FSU 10163]
MALQKQEPVSILRNTSISRSGPSESHPQGKVTRIALSEDEEEDFDYQQHPNQYFSDEDDPPALPISGQALELLQTEKAVKSGYLLKKGEKRRTWKRRWFVLRTTKLAMYKDSKEYKLLRIIDLHEIHSVVHVTNNKYKYMFAISTPKRMFYLQADTQQEMNDWITTLERTKMEHMALDPDNDDATSSLVDQPFSHQRRRSSQGNTSSIDHPPPPSLPTSRRLSKQPPPHVAPVDIPKAVNYHHHDLSAYSPSRTYPLSPISDHQAHSFATEGLASSEDDEEYGWRDEMTHVHHEETRNRVLMEGYLLKLGRNKGWRKRWFVLRTDTLSYYEDDKEYAPHRIIPLTHIIDALEIEPISKNKRFCFKIIIHKRSYVLCASSERELESWLNALSIAMRRAKKGEQQPPALQKLATCTSSLDDGFDNTSHLSGVSGAGAIGGAGGALPGHAHTHMVRGA